MNNILIIGGVAAGIVIPAGFAGVGVVKVAALIIAPPAVNMTLDELHYEDGLFHTAAHGYGH